MIGDIKQPPFLLLAFHVFNRAGGRKQSVAEHDHEDDIKLEALGLVNGREPDLLVIAVVPALLLLGLEIGEQSELGQKFFT